MLLLKAGELPGDEIFLDLLSQLGAVLVGAQVAAQNLCEA